MCWPRKASWRWSEREAASDSSAWRVLWCVRCKNVYKHDGALRAFSIFIYGQLNVVSSKPHVLDDVIDQPFNPREPLPVSFSIPAAVTANIVVGPRWNSDNLNFSFTTKMQHMTQFSSVVEVNIVNKCISTYFHSSGSVWWSLSMLIACCDGFVSCCVCSVHRHIPFGYPIALEVWDHRNWCGDFIV